MADSEHFQNTIREFRDKRKASIWSSGWDNFKSFAVIDDVADMNRMTLVFIDEQIEVKYCTYAYKQRHHAMQLGTWAFFLFILFIQFVYFVTGFSLEAGLPTQLEVHWFILILAVACALQSDVVAKNSFLEPALKPVLYHMHQIYFIVGVCFIV